MGARVRGRVPQTASEPLDGLDALRDQDFTFKCQALPRFFDQA